MFNTHRSHSYTRDAFTTIAKNGISVKPGMPLKKSGEFLDIAGPGDEIVGVSMTDQTYFPDNETVRLERIVYYPVNEDDTYILIISDKDTNVTSYSMVHQYANITTDFKLDFGSINPASGQLEIIDILGPSSLEIRIVPLAPLPPVIPIVPTTPEAIILNSTNSSTYTVADPTQTNFYINADTSAGDITLTTIGGLSVGAIVSIRKISTDTNAIIYDDGTIVYNFVRTQGELITLERNGSQFLVR